MKFLGVISLRTFFYTHCIMSVFYEQINDDDDDDEH